MSHLNTTNPQIYVDCIAAFEQGTTHGTWIDATLDVEEIEAEIKRMLSASPAASAEKWQIQDFEGFGLLVLKFRYTKDIDLIQKIATLIAKHGDLAFAALKIVNTPEAAEEYIENHYQGAYSSLESFAEEIAYAFYSLSDDLRPYFDFEAFVWDLFAAEYSYAQIGYDYHVFSRC